MLKAQFQKWLQQRFQYQHAKLIRQKDVLIFLYQQGYLYVVLIVITFIAGINYANNLILGFCFLISSILCVSFYLTFKQLHQIQVEIIIPELCRVDQVFNVQIQFKHVHASARYVYVKMGDQCYPFLLKENMQSLTIPLFATHRGQFEIPTVQLQSTYPFGLVRAWTYFYLDQIVWIAPKAIPSAMQTSSAQHTGQPDYDEFRELRDYQTGDALQAISWKQAARGQGLYVKQFEDLKDLHVVQIDYARMPSSDHEEKLSLMMALVDECELKQAPYTLTIHAVELAKGVGQQQYLDAQRLLAQVD